MVSLIVGTINRTDQLERLLASLDEQSYKEFEVLVVDQNSDDRLVPVLQQYWQLNLRHLHSPRGLSRARNVGLSYAKGDIIAIPDDDCWYPCDLLDSITQWLDAHPEFVGLSVVKRAADGTPVGPKWPAKPGVITKQNVWNCAISSSIFLRRKVTDTVGYFREDIGVGASTPYQSGEESDYVLRALALGFKMRFEPSYTVHHPNLHGIERLHRTVYSYALGSGYVLRIHQYSWFEVAHFVFRSLGGAVLSLIKLDPANARIYLLRAAGQLRGYICGPRDLARAQSQSNDRA